MQDFDSKLALISLDNFLSKKLTEKFFDKYVQVDRLTNIEDVDAGQYNYLIIDLRNSELVRNFDFKKLTNLNLKIILVLNLYQNSVDLDIHQIVNLNPNLGIILVPEILGEGVYFDPSQVSHALILQAISSEIVKVKIGQQVDVITYNKLVGELIRETLSFGIVGKVLRLVGYFESSDKFVKKYLNIKSENIIKVNSDNENKALEFDVKKEVQFSVQLVINKTKSIFRSLLSQDDSKSGDSVLVTKTPEVQTEANQVVGVELNTTSKKSLAFTKNILFRNIWKVVSFVLLILVIPFMMIVFSLLSLFGAYKFINSNHDLSLKLINSSIFMSETASNFNLGLGAYSDATSIVTKSARIFREIYFLSAYSNTLFSGVLDDNQTSLTNEVDMISATLDKIYSDISFLQTDVEQGSGVVPNLIHRYLVERKLNISEYKNKIYNLKRLSSRLSSILGMDKPKKYLVLFQNNMELRATGGFIGSFALITLDKGRITEIVVNDVYSADGQLKGHVEPPEPIKKYLGEANWYLRDSNWDPDFVKTAKKVEWFLDKEIDQKVDGVIGVDLNLIQNILKVLGPVTLTDFNKVITADNLYLTTQSEVEGEFFAGSIKKASFLTSLAKTLLEETKAISKEKYLDLAKEVAKSLEEKHIQFSIGDTSTQEAVSELGYTGGLNMPNSCGDRCFVDYLAVVDSNLGVNKSNYFLERSFDVSVNLSKERVSSLLNINYKNNSGLNLGPSGIYKSYTRVILPTDAVIGSVQLVDDQTSLSTEYDQFDQGDYKEVGFYVEIPNSSSKKVAVSWTRETTSLNSGGSYELKVRKQAGTDKDKFSLAVDTTDLSLTGNTPRVYNTVLAKDLLIRFKVKSN